ncbi:MAG TPA: response regulator [Kofleriaceae bacterium]
MTRSRALVADDDLEILDMVSRALSQLGLEVITASSGSDLLDKVAEQGPFDLVVTDVAMPWMSGLQVMHSARTAGMRCPVIVITALRDSRTGDQVETLGAQVRRLNKPFSMGELEEAVRASLG